MKKVLIYCANGYGERVLYALDEKEYEVVAISDSNPELWSGKWELDGYKIIPPSDINKYAYDFLIISTSQFAEEIKAELIKHYNVEESKIVIFEPMDREIKWEEERVIMAKRCLSLIKSRGTRGNAAELGVWKGEFAKVINRYLPDRKLYLFDTFEGFDSDKDCVLKEDEGRFKDTSVELVLGKMTTPDNCIIRKGWFPETAGGILDEFAFVSLDADLYEPIMAGLEFFYPKLVQGGYIFIHDYNNFHYTGVKNAVDEFCRNNNINFFPLVDRSFSVVITK